MLLIKSDLISDIFFCFKIKYSELDERITTIIVKRNDNPATPITEE